MGAAESSQRGDGPKDRVNKLLLLGALDSSLVGATGLPLGSVRGECNYHFKPSTFGTSSFSLLDPCNICFHPMSDSLVPIS